MTPPSPQLRKSMAKEKATKRSRKTIWTDGAKWIVRHGELQRRRGRPTSTTSLFKVFAEKLPYESLSAVKKDLLKSGEYVGKGVYVAHDSMGYARYVGRGDIFSRLHARRKAQPLELAYFSFYVVEDKKHEREIETLMIRTAGPLLEFNDRKRRENIQAGDVRDFEAGTVFYERQRRRGRHPKAKRGRPAKTTVRT